MTNEKIWTRRARERARAARVAARAEQAARTQRRRWWVRRIAGSLVAIAAVSAAALHSAPNHSATTVTVAILAAVTIVGGVWAQAWLRPKVGGLTAVVVLSVVGGLFLLAGAALSPQCPDTVRVGRCTSGELANWSLLGMLMPLVGAFLLGTPVIAWRNVARVVRAGVRAWRATAEPGPRPPRRGLLAWFRGSPRRR